MSKPRVVPAEDVHMAAASVVALLRADRVGIFVG